MEVKWLSDDFQNHVEVISMFTKNKVLETLSAKHQSEHDLINETDVRT